MLPSDSSKWPTGLVPDNQNECQWLFVKPEANELFIKFPCSHVYSPTAISKRLFAELEKGEPYLFCDQTGCSDYGKQWSIEWITFIVNFGANEKNVYYFLTNLNVACLFDSKKKRCTNCDCILFKTSTYNDDRVSCPICFAQDFCWLCEKSWNNTYEPHINECPLKPIILEPERKTILAAGHIYGVIKDVPLTRLCPRCGFLIQHAEACRHMTCLKCHHEFCLACLERWKLCKKKECIVAPIQKI